MKAQPKEMTDARFAYKQFSIIEAFLVPDKIHDSRLKNRRQKGRAELPKIMLTRVLVLREIGNPFLT